MRHAANSGAILQLPESYLDMVRPGILLLRRAAEPDAWRTVSRCRARCRWMTRVVYFKVVKPSNPVSYGSTWTPETMTRVVTLPVGYGDGYPRALGNRGEVLIRGVRRPLVGRVCMDQVMASLGPDGTAYNGDEVVLLGAQGDERISVELLAEWAGTIPHDVLAGINTASRACTSGEIEGRREARGGASGPSPDCARFPGASRTDALVPRGLLATRPRRERSTATTGRRCEAASSSHEASSRRDRALLSGTIDDDEPSIPPRALRAKGRAAS